MDKTPVSVGEASGKSEIVHVVNEKLLTVENKQKAKKGLKIAATVLGIIHFIDIRLCKENMDVMIC